MCLLCFILQSYFSSQLFHLFISLSFIGSSTGKKKSEAKSHLLGLFRWVKSISTRGNNWNGFRAHRLCEEVSWQCWHDSGQLYICTALTTTIQTRDHPPGQLTPYMFCREESRSPLNSQPLPWQHSQLGVTWRNRM